MANKTKAQNHSAIAGLTPPITLAALQTVLGDMVDSWEDYFLQVTSVQKAALTPTAGQVVYDTTLLRLECWDSNMWLPLSQREQTLIDCSANPNYPAAGVGDLYYNTVAGKIGGASGKVVFAGDLILCVANNDGGTEAAVGGSWKVVGQGNLTQLTPQPRWIKVYSPTFTTLATAGLTVTKTIYTLPSRGIINDVMIVPTVAFSGGGITAYTAEVGIAGSTSKYHASQSVFTGYAINAARQPYSGVESIGGTTIIQAKFDSSTANLDQASAGALDIYLLLSILPT